MSTQLSMVLAIQYTLGIYPDMLLSFVLGLIIDLIYENYCQ